MTSSKGFTLIELMIVVVVVAILAGIAYPSYQGHTVRVRRSDAQMALTRAAALQEKFYADCTKYAVNLHSSNATDCAANRLKFRTTTEGGFYTISVAAGTIGGGCTTNVCGFTLTATGIGNQANDGPLRIDSTGRKEWNRKNAGTWVSWNER